MTITLELTPALEARLKERALLQGIDIASYLLKLADRDVENTADLVKADRLEDFFVKFAKPGPVLPDEAFTREGIYGDHP